ncbi:hypothetical protein CPLU01_12882 [Colletotrichum plurivorum]|uniref:Uncharacterized protein n=1 Tax=Colletotrichum plurivorum TaxID=2175906 RepID=A0A8H6N4K0_9PEZI|nr:hypothetical protein CPLU01_12882 [Colletotrichum plurivorum]
MPPESLARARTTRHVQNVANGIPPSLPALDQPSPPFQNPRHSINFPSRTPCLTRNKTPGDTDETLQRAAAMREEEDETNWLQIGPCASLVESQPAARRQSSPREDRACLH